MEQLRRTTPIKNDIEYENLASRSPVIYKTPVKRSGINHTHTTYQNNVGSFTVLPSHITPPSGLTKFISKNPFESDLTNRLHLSVISPSVFSKSMQISSSPQQSKGFSWSVDELALIQPAKIEEFPVQQMHCTDPETEIMAQAAIDQFFNKNEIIPSPWDLKRKEIRTSLVVDTPVRSSADTKPELSKSKKDAWSQTVLTFPVELPQHVMEVLKPYFSFTQEQNVESDDANSSNNSLRRKLFFNHEECAENEEDCSTCSSPVKMHGSYEFCPSPPQSGMLIHGVPLKHSPNEERNHETSHIISPHLSPLNISPIHSTVNNMSCEYTRSRSQSVARLDLTTKMSIDQSSFQHKECSNNYSLDESLDKDGDQVAEKKADCFLNLKSNSTFVPANTYAELKVPEKSDTPCAFNIDSGVLESNSKHHNGETIFKDSIDSCKMNISDNCVFQQTNGMLGTSDQQSVSNSVQDTGYQTYSMSSTTNVMDSYTCTPVKQKTCWGERILITDDQLRLSDWKESLENIFSSTPSRSNRERSNHIF